MRSRPFHLFLFLGLFLPVTVFAGDNCTSAQGAYISHYTGSNCTGDEYYYTPYFGYDGIKRSWNGQGCVGSNTTTATARSYRDSSGACTNAWPSGNTLSDFVKVYRCSCGESQCTGVAGAYISHFTGLNCTGEEYYYTPYFFYDGVRRSWDGKGCTGTFLYTVTAYSYKDSSGTCYNAWPSGNTLSDFVMVYR
jgi:hypothetical protein